VPDSLDGEGVTSCNGCESFGGGSWSVASGKRIGRERGVEIGSMRRIGNEGRAKIQTNPPYPIASEW
jgi:hypothetical protein